MPYAHPGRRIEGESRVAVVIIEFPSSQEAYAAAAELKRLYTAQTWGDIEVRRTGDRAQMTLPPHSWRDPQLREIVRRFGGHQTG